MVPEMKRLELKKKESFTRRLFRLLRPRSDIRQSMNLQKEDVSVSLSKNFCHDYRKIIGIAALEAERKKAEGLMEWQKRRFVGY